MSYYDNIVPFSTLLGLTINFIRTSHDEVIFNTNQGEFKLYHDQDCCESVVVESIDGDLSDLLNSPITLAEESTNVDIPSKIGDEYDYSFTWTFYRLATVKGFVTIRWYGSSNGYYSESVTFIKL